MTAAPPKMPTPPRAAPPAARPPSPPPAGGTGPAVDFGTSSGQIVGAQRVGLYGPGGIGKSSLATLAPKPKVIDLEEGTRELAVDRVTLPAGVEWTWPLLRKALQTPSLWEGVETVIIDSGTKAEELAVAHTLATVTSEKGQRVDSIEGYGYGKGFQHVYDTFLAIFADLDQHIRAGRNVIVITHDCTANVPNPAGDDWIRYEPRLSSPSSGKASIRLRFREWCDSLLFISYDVVVDRDGKGQGHGTRTIYPQEMPTHMAKSRRATDPIQFIAGDGSIWSTVLNRK